MRGSINGQICRLVTEINRIGVSKFLPKQDIRAELKSEGKAVTPQAIAERMGIHGGKTLNNYVGCWKELANFAKSEFELKDMELIDGETVRTFLELKIEEGKSYSHFENYCAAFGALENALKSFTTEVRQEDRDFGIRTVINAIRPEAKAELKSFEGTRNYSDPQKLISELSGTSALVAKIQLESGCRVSEASKITADQLKGMTTDKFTGKEIGQFDFYGKGGKYNIGNLLPSTYKELQHEIQNKGELKLSQDTYRNNLQKASETSGQDYNGSHGLRWNFAQNRVGELQAHGVGYVQSFGQVSSEMGHNRVYMTEHYLGKN